MTRKVDDSGRTERSSGYVAAQETAKRIASLSETEQQKVLDHLDKGLLNEFGDLVRSALRRLSGDRTGASESVDDLLAEMYANLRWALFRLEKLSIPEQTEFFNRVTRRSPEMSSFMRAALDDVPKARGAAPLCIGEEFQTK